MPSQFSVLGCTHFGAVRVYYKDLMREGTEMGILAYEKRDFDPESRRMHWSDEMEDGWNV